MKVQEGKFKLQDLLVVPMQRVLKYHLLLKVGVADVKRGEMSRDAGTPYIPTVSYWTQYERGRGRGFFKWLNEDK